MGYGTTGSGNKSSSGMGAKTPSFMKAPFMGSPKIKAPKATPIKPIKFAGKGTRARLNTAAGKMFFK